MNQFVLPGYSSHHRRQSCGQVLNVQLTNLSLWEKSHPCMFVCLQMQPQLLPKALTVRWLIMASGSYSRASSALAADIQNSDLEDIEMCRVINDRIMTVRGKNSVYQV